MTFVNIVMWETRHNTADWVCFKTHTLLEILNEDPKSTSGGVLCIFGSRTFVPVSWMCKKQSSVSHNSTESEISSLDAGLRVDVLPALDLWDIVIEVLHSTIGKTTLATRKLGQFLKPKPRPNMSPENRRLTN